MDLCSQQLCMAGPITSTRQLGKLRHRAKRDRARIPSQAPMGKPPAALSLGPSATIVTEAMARAKTQDNLK